MSGLLMGIGWYGRERRTMGQDGGPSTETVGKSAQARFAVRRDWPDGGHEFIRARTTEADAARQLVHDRDFWRRGPVRPRLSVVLISAHDFDLHGRHRRMCKAPDCADSIGSRPAGGAR